MTESNLIPADFLTFERSYLREQDIKQARIHRGRSYDRNGDGKKLGVISARICDSDRVQKWVWELPNMVNDEIKVVN